MSLTHEILKNIYDRVPLVDERLVLLGYCAFTGTATIILFLDKRRYMMRERNERSSIA